MFPFGEGAVGYWNVHDVRLVRGNWMRARSRHRVVPAAVPGRSRGEPVSPFARVAACADFGSGVGNPLRMTNASGDQPRGDDSRAPSSRRRMGVPRVGSVGATARCRAWPRRMLFDEVGVIGRGVADAARRTVGPALVHAPARRRRVSRLRCCVRRRWPRARTRRCGRRARSGGPTSGGRRSPRPGRRAPRSCAGPTP